MTLLGLVVGALAWATSRQSLRTENFTIPSLNGSAKSGVVVRPAADQRFPVVMYLHGSGDSLERSTGTLRQLAELGLAAVCLDYTQTNAGRFATEFDGGLAWVGRQSWADTNRVAWVGFSLGAQRILSYVCAHPEVTPPLLIRLAGGPVPELERETPKLRGRVWMVHGEHDETFRVSDVEEVRKKLVAAGMSVELTVLPGQGHTFGENRPLILRGVAERCAEELKGARKGAAAP